MKLIVNNMSCQHCVKSVTVAINELDPQAKVAVDLTKKEVTIESHIVTEKAAISAIDSAGFEFVRIID